MEIVAYACAIIIGVTLGLIGAGGSILSIPVLVYLLGIEATKATSYSLFIVGVAAFVAAITYARNKLISYKAFLVFGIPSVIAILFARQILLPAIPDVLFTANQFILTKNNALMIFLALLMIAASYSMIRKSKNETVSIEAHKMLIMDYIKMSLQALFVGTTVGLVGAGGGFLIIPALVLLSKLPIKKAIGTSLCIITLNSSIGFIGDLGLHTMNWQLLLLFTSLTITGTFIGAYIAKFIRNDKLKPAFGWFVLVVGMYIFLKELVL
jgi:uncharacterized membrane protein YfcA